MRTLTRMIKRMETEQKVMENENINENDKENGNRTESNEE
jgi:hypothetical protein